MHVAFIFGTRPEVIKTFPVISKFIHDPHFKVTLITTGQHRQILDQMLEIFGLSVDIDLNEMIYDQELANLTGKLCRDLNTVLSQKAIDLVFVQGDTTTTFVGALTSFYKKIPCAHVEAGLRSFDRNHPFPEEMNRILVGKLALWHFAPTETEKQNLLSENIREENILVTGNTVIDALNYIAHKDVVHPYETENRKIILVTTHRRENWGAPLKAICLALKKIATLFPQVLIVFPVHPNPHVHDTVFHLLEKIPNIHLIAPMDYQEFCKLMQKSYLILTDSGGIQEEAPALGKPVLVVRDVTERMEVVTAGVGRIIGTYTENIVSQVTLLLEDADEYALMAKGISPYGDGHAAERILQFIKEKYNLKP